MLGGGLSFTQTFTSNATGVPTELGINMSYGATAFNVRVRMSVNGVAAFDQTYTNKLPRQTTWGYATVFPLTGFTRSINTGDTVAFTVTPASEVMYSAILWDEEGMPKSMFPRYGVAVRSQFYLRK